MPLFPSSVIQSVSNPPLLTSTYIEVMRVFPMFPRRVFLQWVFRNPTVGETYRFTVDRAGSAEGPWETLTVPPIYDFYYVDMDFPANPIVGEPDLMSMSRVVYYRITATPFLGGTSVSVIKKMEPWLDRRREGIHRKLVRDAMIALQRVVGTEIAAVKKLKWGTRCSLCLTNAGTSVDPYCPECYGTSFTGGYWTPVYGWAQMFTAPISVQSALQGETEIRQTRILMANVPQMDKEDLLVFLRSNKRFRVLEVTPTQIHNVDVHQELVVSELSPSSAEYNINVDPWRAPCWWV
jgi:hypothetical protein